MENAQLYLTAHWSKIGGKEQHLLQVVLPLPSIFCGQQPNNPNKINTALVDHVIL